MMTQEQLDQIKARAESATPGPWHDQTTDDGYLRVSVNPDDVNGVCGFGDLEETDYQDHADARFIAHARADVPMLVEEVVRWQERARLYHNHLVMLRRDTEAVIQ